MKIWMMYVIGAFVGIMIWIGLSYFEMKAFNRFSSKEVTLTDAMFIQLRIIDSASNPNNNKTVFDCKVYAHDFIKTR